MAVFKKRVFLASCEKAAPEAGEIFQQKDLYETLTKMVEAEQDALKKGRHVKRLSTPHMIVLQRRYRQGIYIGLPGTGWTYNCG